MSPSFYEELLNYAEKHSQDRSGYVFTTTMGKPVKERLYPQEDASDCC